MSSSRRPSPARSQGEGLTPRHPKSRRTRSVGSPARSNASGRLSSMIQEYREADMGSFVLSPLVRRSMLPDNTDIEEPRRKSWWKKLNENSRDVIEVLEDNKFVEPNNIIEELDIEILSQEKKNYTLDLPESSDSESINSIVIPQRKLFTEKENQHQKKFGEFGTRDTLSKLHKTNATSGDIVNTATKELFQNKPRSKPLFPAALLNISPNKTTGDKTLTAIEPKGQVRNIFGNRQGTKRKNMFANFIVSESEDEIPDIQPKVFGFQKRVDAKRFSSSSSRGIRNASPASNVTTDMELDDWKLLPSSTMVENQLEAMMADGQTPKRAKLSKLSEAKESDAGTNSIEATNKTKQSNKSTMDKNKSKTITKEISELNISTRSRSKVTQDDDELINISQERQNKSQSTSPKSNDSNSSIVTRSRTKSIVVDKLNSSTNKSQNNSSNIKNAKISLKQTENDDEGPVVNNHTQAMNKSIPKIHSSTQHQNSIDTEEHHDSVNPSNKPEQMDDDDEFNLTLEYEIDDIDNEVDEVREANKQNEISVTNKSNKNANYSKNMSTKDTNLKENSLTNLSTINKSLQKIKNNIIVGESAESGSCTQGDKETNIPIKEKPNNKIQNESTHKGNTETIINDDGVADQEEHLNNNKQSGALNRSRKDRSLIKSHEVKDKSRARDDEQEVSFKKNENIDEGHQKQSQEVVQEDENNKDKHENRSREEQNENYESEKKQNKSQEILDESQELENESEEEDQNESQEMEDESKEEQNESQEMEDESEEIQNESEEKQNESPVMEDESEKEQNESQEMQDESEDEQNESQEMQDESQEVQSENDDVQGDNEESQSEREEVENEDNEQENESEAENDAEEINVSQEVETENDEVDNQEHDDDHESTDEEAAESDQEHESDQEAENDQNDHQDNQEQNNEEVGTDTPNVSHDTTGRNRKKPESPEVIRHNKTNHSDSFTVHGRNTSVRKTKSMIKHTNIRPSLVRESMNSTDGVKSSSAEGSGWDSHRTTRKTLRQTFGKDFSPRKSLRALVMEKSVKRQTLANDITSMTGKFPQANSTELPEDSAHHDDFVEMDHEPQESDHEASRRMRQTTLESYLQKMRQKNMEKKAKIEEAVKNSLKNESNHFKVPRKPIFARRPITKTTKPKAKPVKSFIPLEDLPEEVIEDMKYKPPKRFQPSNAPWITKRLYKYLETKLEPKYDYKARVRSEKLVESLYQFAKESQRHAVASPDAIDVLKHEMARLDIVRTHFEFYEFFHEFMPREIRIKVIPDVVNNIPLPRHGVFVDILNRHTQE